eukprot:147688-Pyramimonas_sp.AAC.1
MRLSMRAQEDESCSGTPCTSTELRAFRAIPPSTWISGKVVHRAQFGAFVRAQVPHSKATAVGLVHISQIKDGFVDSVEAELAMGQEVRVRV